MFGPWPEALIGYLNCPPIISKLLLHRSYLRPEWLQSAIVNGGHGPKKKIQSAIDAVGVGTDNFGYIEVAPWVYGEKIDFGGKNIILTSEVSDDYSVVSSTIIDGTSQSPNPKSTVTFSGGEDYHTELRGFTITGGNGTEYPDPVLNLGGGIWGRRSEKVQ